MDMKFTKNFHIFLIFNIFITFCQQAEVETSTEVNEVPQVNLNCNYIESSDEVIVTINSQVISKNKKLFNGSLKGQGLASEFYKQLPDINKNSSYESEFIFKTITNGTYTFVIFYENSDGVFTTQCNGEVSSIDTTTTTVKKPVTTSTTVKQSTTTTTVKKPVTTTTTTLPIIVNVNVSQELEECRDKKQKSKLRIDNSASTIDLQLAVQKYDKEWISVFDGTIKAGEVLSFDYTVDEVSNSGYSNETWNTIRWVWDFRQETENWPGWKYTDGILACEIEYDESKYKKYSFTNRYDNPFICEIPEDEYDFARCISTEKWRQEPNMEVAASNWIDFCIQGNYYYTGSCEDS